MNGTLGAAGRVEMRHPEPGLGVPCNEAQCDGVPCPEVRVDCAVCERAHPVEVIPAQQPGKPGDADA
jgi:hypothetical protein